MSNRYSGSEDEKLALDTYTKFVRAMGSLKSSLDSSDINGSLSPTQFGVMEALLHLGPLNQKTIASKILSSKSNVVAVIDKLEEVELVKRERCDEDRRVMHVHLTAKGKETIEEILPGHVSAIVEEFGILSKKEQTDLGKLCRKLGLKTN